MMPVIKEAFDLMGDDIFDFCTKKEALKNRICFCDEKWTEEFKTKLLKLFDDDKRANLILSRLKKQMKKQFKMAYISYDKC